jgi:Kelch motif
VAVALSLSVLWMFPTCVCSFLLRAGIRWCGADLTESFPFLPRTCMPPLIEPQDGSRVRVFPTSTYLLDLSTFQWAAQEMKRSGNTPSGRMFHSFTDLGEYALMFGGTGKRGYSNEMFLLNYGGLHWSRVTGIGRPPPPRSHHSACVIGRRVYIFGGSGPGGRLYCDCHVFDTIGHSWHQLDVLENNLRLLGKRFGHCAVALDGKIYCFGGDPDENEGTHHRDLELSSGESSVICILDTSKVRVPPPVADEEGVEKKSCALQ